MFGCRSRAIAWASTPEPLPRLRREMRPGQDHLQGDQPVQLAVAGAVDDPDGPATELAQDLIARHLGRLAALAAVGDRPGPPVGAGGQHFLLEPLDERLRFGGCLRGRPAPTGRPPR